MRYIRTKNNLFGFYKYMPISICGHTKGKYYHGVCDRRLHRLGAGLLQDKFIIKQVDTIEELCDVLIIKSKDYRGVKRSQ